MLRTSTGSLQPPPFRAAFGVVHRLGLTLVTLGLVALGLTPTAHADPPLEARIAAHRAALAASPAQLGPRVRLIELLVREGRSDAAIVELELLDALRPNEPVADRLRAQALDRAGELLAAIAVLDAALAERDDMAARWHRGTLLERVDRFEEALVDFEAVAAAQPGVERSAAVARVFQRLGRVEAARVALEDGVRTHRGAVVLRRSLIELELAADRPLAALPHLDALIAGARVATRWRVLRAHALEAAGRIAEADAERRAALADAERLMQRRRSALALIERGRVLASMGRRAEALADLEQALRRAPRSREAAQLLAQVRNAGAGQ